MRVGVFALVLAAVFPLACLGTFLAKSSVKACIKGDKSSKDLTCRRKLVVTLALRGGQGRTETYRTTVANARIEETSRDAQILGSLDIEVMKTRVNVFYPLRYRSSVNNRPGEKIITKVHTNTGILGLGARYDYCKDAPGSDGTTCGYAMNGTSGERIRDSQGYCCVCHNFDAHPFVRGHEAGVECNDWDDDPKSLYKNLKRKRASAHCLRFSKLWYNVYELLPPVMNFTITLNLKYRTANGHKTQILTVSPSVPVAASTDKKVVTEYLGDLAPSEYFRDLQSKFLLVPNIRYNMTARQGFDLELSEIEVNQVNYGQQYWMLVDRDMVDFSGRSCGKIGVEYTGFRYQSKKCSRRPMSCLINQPQDLWLHDVNIERLHGDRVRGQYLTKHFGRVEESRFGAPTNNTNITYLSFLPTERQRSIVTLQIDADDLIITSNRSPGVLVSITTHNFESRTHNGRMYVQVLNTGYIRANYMVTVTNCSEGISAISAQITTLESQQSSILTFQLYQSNIGNLINYCAVALFDQSQNEVDSKVAYFTTVGDCECLGRSAKCGACQCDGSNGKKFTLDVLDIATNMTTAAAVGLCGLSPDWLPDYTNFTRPGDSPPLTPLEQLKALLKRWYVIVAFVVLFLLVIGGIKLCFEGYFIKRDLDSQIINDLFFDGPPSRFRPRQKVYCPHHDRPKDVRQIVGFTFFVYLPVAVVLGLCLVVFRAALYLPRRKARNRLLRMLTTRAASSSAPAVADRDVADRDEVFWELGEEGDGQPAHAPTAAAAGFGAPMTSAVKGFLTRRRSAAAEPNAERSAGNVGHGETHAHSAEPGTVRLSTRVQDAHYRAPVLPVSDESSEDAHQAPNRKYYQSSGEDGDDYGDSTAAMEQECGASATTSDKSEDAYTNQRSDTDTDEENTGTATASSQRMSTASTCESLPDQEADPQWDDSRGADSTEDDDRDEDESHEAHAEKRMRKDDQSSDHSPKHSARSLGALLGSFWRRFSKANSAEVPEKAEGKAHRQHPESSEMKRRNP